MKTDINNAMNQSDLEGNTCNQCQRQEIESQRRTIVLVLFLIGLESGANFSNQSQIAVQQKKKRTRNYFSHSN